MSTLQIILLLLVGVVVFVPLCGFLGIGHEQNQESTSTETDQAVTDEGTLRTYASGKNSNLTVAEPGAVAVAAYATYLSPGSTSLTNFTGDLTIGEGAAVAALAREFNTTLAGLGSQNAEALAGALAAQAATIETALGDVAAQSESELTGGLTSLGKLVLYGLGILAAAFVLWRWLK